MPRSQISERESATKSGGGGLSRPSYGQVEKRIRSAYIRKEPEATSTSLAKAKAIKQQNFEGAHVCAKLLKAHDEKQLN